MVFPKYPQISKEATFTINISDFSYKNLEVKWSWHTNQLTDNVITSEAEIRENGLYSCSSSVRYTPKDKDLIQCDVVTNKRRRYIKQYQVKDRGAARLALEPSTL
ncbi:hypothetical protein XENTR_v10010535 [Xenopus tropicalis]|nr:hypothetical protein XENTR_v10010535 [Xenopus tropicalis]